MKTNFNIPQRQSLVGVLVMFTDTLQKIIRAMWPLLVVWLFKFNQFNKCYLGVGIFSVIALLAIIAYLQYRNFTFYIDEANDEFIINKGILNKSKIAIQLHKIQQVNINQTFIQKIIGVHALDVDTAGSNKKEVAIRAISHDLAIALKTKLLSEAQKDQTHNQTLDAAQLAKEEPFIKISFISLLKIGVTSNYVRSFGILMAFFITIYENVKHILQNTDASVTADAVDEKIDRYLSFDMAMYSAFLFIIVLFAAIVSINLGRTIIRYFDFTLTRQNHSVLLSFGLLNTKNTIIKPGKVQIVALSQNWLQKKMDVLNIKIKQATGSESDQENKKAALEIPGCNALEKDDILKLLFGQIPQHGAKLQPNWRYVLFPVLFYIIIPVSVLLLYVFNNEARLHYLAFLPVYLGFVLIMLYFSYRHYRLFVNENYIIRQSGAWDIDREIIEPYKIQSIKVSQLFWHKRANIGSITFTTAGGNLSFRLANFDRVKELANLWLYQVETSEKNWM